MGRIVLISGATSGIGLETAKLLADAGSVVVGCGLAPDKAVAEISGRPIELSVLDVRRVPEVRAFVEAAAARHGRIDVLVNAAGVLAMEATHAVSEESFDAQVDTVLKGTFFLTSAVLPHMMKQGAGLVVNVASIAGEIAAPKLAAYAAAKAGILSLTRSLALEYAPSGIRVVSVSPGVVETKLMNKLMVQMIARKSPLGRAAQPREVAELIRFLLSDAATQFTGTNVTMAGGIGL